MGSGAGTEPVSGLEEVAEGRRPDSAFPRGDGRPIGKCAWGQSHRRGASPSWIEAGRRLHGIPQGLVQRVVSWRAFDEGTIERLGVGLPWQTRDLSVPHFPIDLPFEKWST
jgi:hypothetical protein